MSGTDSRFPDIDQNVATNVREFRENLGLSQEELAQRMIERGFGFSQATIWKIESGQRSVKISEAVALGDIFDLTWRELTAAPAVSRHQASLEAANRRAYEAFNALRQAAELFLEAQLELSLTIRLAQDAGLAVHEDLYSWLEIPAERAVLEARTEEDREKLDEQLHYKVDAILETLREHGYTTPRPEDWVSSKQLSEEPADTAG